MSDKKRDINAKIVNWSPPKRPENKSLRGDYCQLERLDFARHGRALYRANAQSDALWDFLPYGPFDTIQNYESWVTEMAAQDDPFFYAIKNMDTGQFEGVASYLRITPQSGSIEVGHINFAPPLQNTRAATDAMFQMMRWAFEAGYRRYEWKCNAANINSRRAAMRLGFSYEGIFRQATIAKGRNRDTVWFAAIDKEWPAIKAAFETWLEPSNFDENGQQYQALSQLTAPILNSRDPEGE